MCTSAVYAERAASGCSADALVVTPATVAHLASLIDGDDHFERAFGIRVVPGYLEFEGGLQHSLGEITVGGVDPRWMTHLFVHEEDYALVGLGGFKGAPVDGRVEIGYGIAPSYRGRGLATAAAAALVEIARRRGVTTVVAHTLAETNPSTRVLCKLDFERKQEVRDVGAEVIWRWELDLAA
jgi:GNAT superfamily N-acetyltransferase